MKSNNIKYLDILVIINHLSFVQYFLMPSEFFVIGNFWVDYAMPAAILFCISLYAYFFYILIVKSKLLKNQFFWIVCFLLSFVFASFCYYFSVYRKTIYIEDR
jgi:hypothetical protein